MKVNPVDVFRDVLTNRFAQFDGRASKTEYWSYFLVHAFIVIVATAIGRIVGLPIIGYVASLALLIPFLAVSVRRLHDVGKPGWFVVLFFIPIVGIVLWLVFMVKDGEPGANDYGRPFELS